MQNESIRPREGNVQFQERRKPGRARMGSKNSFHQRISDEARFIKAWVGNPGTTGAVSPSGRFLARAMARCVNLDLPGPIIELGPGTGPVTQALIDHGVAQERLVLVEYDAEFCELLKKRFPGARVVQGDAYNLSDTLGDLLADLAEGPAAAVVSGLPLLNKPENDRLSLVRDVFDLLHPDGNFIQFTYGLVSPVPRRPKSGEPVLFEAQDSPPVWLNLPPAKVWVYRPCTEAAPQRGWLSPMALLSSVGERTLQARDGLLERTAQIGTGLRLAREALRIDIELRAMELRRGYQLKPALTLLKRLASPDQKTRP